MKLSIIIPVYQTESTLGRCLSSIVGQDFGDYEVILVDDGSTDGSPRLCDEWSARDGRISVLHKVNGGLSDARNAGIERAKGEFLTFVDSDDYIADGTLAAVMAVAAGADLTEYPVWQHYGSPRQQLLTFADRAYATVADYWSGCQAYLHTYACNKVYRRSLFDSVRFPKGRLFEDAATLPLLLRQQPRIATTASGLYYYCQNGKGITATTGGQGLRQLLDAHLTAAMPMDDRYYLHLLNLQMDVCELTGDRPRLTYRKVKPVGGVKQKLKAVVQNAIGIEKICRLNKIIHRLCRR